MILGDNFYGQNLSSILQKCIKLKLGSKIILHKVFNPKQFGVAKIDKKKRIKKIIEKPRNSSRTLLSQDFIFLIIV